MSEKGRIDCYRYGFNGQEKDDEIYGAGNSTTAEFWQYYSRLGRRWNLDPKPNPKYSSYSCFANNPIYFTDPYGDTVKFASNTKQETIDKINGLKESSSLFNEVYEYLDNSDHTVIISDAEDLGIANGYFRPPTGKVIRESGQEPRVEWQENSTISLREDCELTTVCEELFHAYQYLHYEGAPLGHLTPKVGSRSTHEWEAEAKVAVGMMLIQRSEKYHEVLNYNPITAVLFDEYKDSWGITNGISFNREGYAIAEKLYNNNKAVTSISSSLDVSWYFAYLQVQRSLCETKLTNEGNYCGFPQRNLTPDALNSLFK